MRCDLQIEVYRSNHEVQAHDRLIVTRDGPFCKTDSQSRISDVASFGHATASPAKRLRSNALVGSDDQDAGRFVPIRKLICAAIRLTAKLHSRKLTGRGGQHCLSTKHHGHDCLAMGQNRIHHRGSRLCFPTTTNLWIVCGSLKPTELFFIRVRPSAFLAESGCCSFSDANLSFVIRKDTAISMASPNR